MTIIIDPANPKIKISSLNKGLVGHWPLDQESFNPATKRFTDKSVYSNHGTGNGTQLGSATPGFQVDRMGQLVRSAPFNGSDDYIDCGNIGDFVTDKTFSASVWVYFKNTVDNNWLVGYQHSWDSISAFRLRQNGINVQFGIYSGDLILATIPISTGWHHIIGTYNGVQLKVYADGGIPGTFSTSVTPQYNSNNKLSIGARYTGDWGSFFNGSIADARIYNHALSQQEITLLYKQYRSKLRIS